MAKKQSATVSANEAGRPPSSTRSAGTEIGSAGDPDHPSATPSRERLVQEAAYRRFEARGGEHGHDEEDWLEAEKEVRPPEGN